MTVEIPLRRKYRTVIHGRQGAVGDHNHPRTRVKIGPVKHRLLHGEQRYRVAVMLWPGGRVRMRDL